MTASTSVALLKLRIKSPMYAKYGGSLYRFCIKIQARGRGGLYIVRFRQVGGRFVRESPFIYSKAKVIFKVTFTTLVKDIVSRIKERTAPINSRDGSGNAR